MERILLHSPRLYPRTSYKMLARQSKCRQLKSILRYREACHRDLFHQVPKEWSWTTEGRCRLGGKVVVGWAEIWESRRPGSISSAAASLCSAGMTNPNATPYGFFLRKTRLENSRQGQRGFLIPAPFFFSLSVFSVFLFLGDQFDFRSGPASDSLFFTLFASWQAKMDRFWCL